jgi:hypothetical protein
MSRSLQFGLPVLAVLGPAAVASAQLNGAWNPNYGGPLAQQLVNTGFGNATDGNIQFANGSELDAAFSYTAGGFVNMLFTGNLQSNFNKLVIFIDNGSGSGQNTITGGADLPGNYNGFTFDAGFNATHYIIANGGGDPFGWYLNAGNLVANEGGYVGSNDGQSGGILSGGSYGSGMILSAIDNSNIAGVDGNVGDPVVDPLTASTGMEFAIDLSWLGLTGDTFRVTAFINGSGHDYASNQFLGSLPAFTGNLGGDGAGNYTGNLAGINLASIAGDQFFTVTVPAPGVIAVLGLAGLARGRRRSA